MNTAKFIYKSRKTALWCNVITKGGVTPEVCHNHKVGTLESEPETPTANVDVED